MEFGKSMLCFNLLDNGWIVGIFQVPAPLLPTLKSCFVNYDPGHISSLHSKISGGGAVLNGKSERREKLPGKENQHLNSLTFPPQ